MKKVFMILTVLLIAGLMITCDTAEGKWNMLTMPELPILWDFGAVAAEGVVSTVAGDNMEFTFTKGTYDASKFNVVVAEYSSNVWWGGGAVNDDSADLQDWSGNGYDGDKYALTLKFEGLDATKITKVVVSPGSPAKGTPAKVYFTKLSAEDYDALP